MSNFVLPEEITYFIESIRPFQLVDVGSNRWLEIHEMVIKLSQQAILEASEHREEEVKEFLISKNKLKVLIHEAYCIFLWKTRVLPHIIEIDPNPHATFLIYTVLFHEGAVISLLDTTLYHASGCEVLQDSAVDLVDYCALAVAQVIGLVSMGYHENDTNIDVDEAVLSELERQKRDLIFKIGMRCISILCYMADNAAMLPLSATRRMVVTHDIPWLIADVLQFRPWQRRKKQGLQKYIDEKWVNVQGEAATKLVKHEAQSWFCLRQLVFNQNIMQSYEMNNERRNHLSKCHCLLQETVLDQLPPLIDLKQYLCNLGLSSTDGKKQKLNLVLEEVPEIRNNLEKEAERMGGFFQIAQIQEPIFLCKDPSKICEMAQRLNNAYNTDLLVKFEQENDVADAVASGTHSVGSDKKCGYCAGNAEKKCSNCRTVYYCSRNCQVQDWEKHKQNCTKA